MGEKLGRPGGFGEKGLSQQCFIGGSQGVSEIIFLGSKMFRPFF